MIHSTGMLLAASEMTIILQQDSTETFARVRTVLSSHMDVVEVKFALVFFNIYHLSSQITFFPFLLLRFSCEKDIIHVPVV